ncbi:DUF7281 domain-containing protein [Halomonas sp. LBP4]|uniref:DUF7281 domain-containing protein n=1 Tax=Halomonas sp. LBP4 TaxID=2044917 RepID=UPI000D770218|nr:hypothetical protein [Halomonas sp. LBP4]PXX97549.1 hypothetical protein CR157_12610 [Halomonas sp. LBP4]
MSLSPGAYRLLRGVRETLRRESIVERPRGGKVVAEIEAWCAEYDIDLTVHRLGKRLRFDRRLLADMGQVLDSLGQPPLDAALSGRTTAEQADQGSLEAKSVRESPRARRTLVSLPVLARPAWLAAEPREYRDLDWRSLDLGAFDALIQVENLDSFYAFTPDIVATAHCRQPLVAYRGDRHYGGGFAALGEAWSARGKLHLYFGDFDAAGIGVAMASRATHLLLPPLEWLKRHATADHLPAAQMTAQAALRDYRATLPGGHPLRGYLTIILDRQCGLRQQWFGNDLILVPLD